MRWHSIYQAGRVAQMQNDYATARQPYEKAASMDYAASYVNMGQLFHIGGGVAKDY